MAQKFAPPFGTAGVGAKKPMPKKAPEAEMMGGEGEEPEDGAEIAQEHGPATEVHIEHEHEMGSHHVRSSHPDGHMHESDHESAEAAHEHGKKLAGVGGAEHDGEGEEDGAY